MRKEDESKRSRRQRKSTRSRRAKKSKRERKPSSASEEGTVSKEVLSDAKCYHGFLPREDAEKLLKEDGDFLVRSTEPGKGKHMISVKHLAKIVHIMINHTKTENLAFVETYVFDDIPKLIRFYRERKLPLNNKTGAILLNPVPRQVWELLHEQIKLSKKMGEGAFGAVHRGQLRLSTKDISAVAVKLHHLDALKENFAREQMAEIMREARLMRQYKHRNVVKFYGVAAKEEPLMIVMELVRGGGLDTFVQKHAIKLENLDRISFALDAVRGLEYLHSKNCIHRDIAARNCLISHEYVVKISDFGLSQEVVGMFRQKDHAKVPLRWVAPEVFKTLEYGAKTDVYSYGIMLWEIFSDGGFPYEGMASAAVRKEVVNGYRMDAPPVMPKRVKSIMQDCWQMEPETRPTFQTVRERLQKIFDDIEIDKKLKGFIAPILRKQRNKQATQDEDWMPAPEPDDDNKPKQSRYH